MTVPAGVCFEDVAVGQALPELTKGPMSPVHLMRWSAAIENWHRIHYDQTFAVDHERLPGLLINGSWKQHVIAQMLKDWIRPGGWVWRITFQYRGMDVVGDTITAFGEVTGTSSRDRLGLVQCRVGLRNQEGKTSTDGEATLALPLRCGPALPYPFPGEL